MVEICQATIKGISTYSPSRYITETKRRGEEDDTFDARIWREKSHVNGDGSLIIPFMGFKKALDAAARFTPRKVKGRGAQTYANQVVSGVLLTHPLHLEGLTREQLRFETFMCSPTGDRRGLGKRVPRRYPMIDTWGGPISYYVTNPTIQHDILEEYIRESGLFIGIGRFRPEVGGVNGRFVVEKFEWSVT